jgi:methyltransferase (TIGR00027 family)
VRVFEVDVPATQQWKREKLSAAGIGPIGEVTLVSLDLRVEPVVDRLVAAGLSTARPAFVSWLGVSFYLEAEAIAAALRGASLAPGSELVMNYVLTPELRDDGARMPGSPCRWRWMAARAVRRGG